jgi:hypothetical protein
MGSKVSGRGENSDFLNFSLLEKEMNASSGNYAIHYCLRNSQRADNLPLKMSQIHLFGSLNNNELKNSRSRSGSVVFSVLSFGVVIWKWLYTDDSQRGGGRLDMVQNNRRLNGYHGT